MLPIYVFKHRVSVLSFFLLLLLVVTFDRGNKKIQTEKPKTAKVGEVIYAVSFLRCRAVRELC